MRALLFILRLMMKIIAAPVVLALALFTWICFGLLYVSSFIFAALSLAWPPPWWRYWGLRCL